MIFSDMHINHLMRPTRLQRLCCNAMPPWMTKEESAEGEEREDCE
jgi:hypothetical protein